MKLSLKDLGAPVIAVQARAAKGKGKRVESAQTLTPSRKNKGSAAPQDFQQMLTQQFQTAPGPTAFSHPVDTPTPVAEKSTAEKKRNRVVETPSSASAESHAKPVGREPERAVAAFIRSEKDTAPPNVPMPVQVESPASTAAFTVVTAAATPLARMLETAVEDSGLRVGVMSHAAHINIEVPGGELSLHLRVRGGVAEIELKGADAEVLRASQDVLRVALAGQGIALGRFALSPDPVSAIARVPMPVREVKEVRPTAPGRPRNVATKSSSTANETPRESARIHVNA